jgi:uncharacterized membrane protein
VTARARRRLPTREQAVAFGRRVVRAQWPIVSVFAIFLLALVLVAAGFWRRGSLLIGIGAGVAAAYRLLLSEERAGLLVVRSRGIDFATMTTVSVVMMYVASTIDPLGTS